MATATLGRRWMKVSSELREEDGQNVDPSKNQRIRGDLELSSPALRPLDFLTFGHSSVEHPASRIAHSASSNTSWKTG